MSGLLNHWMKSKLAMALAGAVLAGSLAYWFGYTQGSIGSGRRVAEYYSGEEQNRWRDNGYHQAWICLGALTNLEEGKQAEAQAVLEENLSEGVGRLVSSWENPRGDQFTLRQILLLDAARNYRLRNAWTNEDTERVERLEKAFKMLDAPEQVKRLENIKRVMGPGH